MSITDPVLRQTDRLGHHFSFLSALFSATLQSSAVVETSKWNKIQKLQSLWLLNYSCKIQGFAHVSLKEMLLKKRTPERVMLKSSIL